MLVATGGAGALARAAQVDPDIVLLDAVMPGLDGFEVARRLKAGPDTAHIPVVSLRRGRAVPRSVVNALASRAL